MSASPDRVCIITGASGGIGRATALALAADGVTLCLVGRRLDALEAVAREVRARAARPRICRADFGRDEEAAALVAGLRREVERVDVLVHAAGVIALGPVEEAPAATFDRQYAVNVRGAYVLTQGVLPLLKAARGQVVFINSTAGLAGRAGSSQYAATKHALRGLADSLRDEVNDDGIRVLTLYLGRTATPMQQAIHAAEGRPWHPERLVRPEDVAAIISAALSLPRTVEITEITARPMLRPLPPRS